MSEIKVNSVVNSTGDNDSGLDLATNDQVKVKIANAEDFIFKANSLEVQTGSNIDMNGTELILDADGDTSIDASTDDTIVFDTGGSERMRLIDDGKLLVGKTSSGDYVTGFEVQPAGAIISYRSSGVAGLFGRTDDGEILRLTRNNGIVGNIGVYNSDNIFIQSASTHSGLGFGTNQIHPFRDGAEIDNVIAIGASSTRFDDAFITNGVTTGSDQNEKQDIANLTAKELKVANKLSALFKTFRWKDRVVEKGDKARTHSGIMAQDIQSAFSAEGLDASDYGMFMSNTWTNEEGKEQTRLGVRYPELFSFIFSSIEARLTALESK